jgi:hypothetical protein
MRFNYRYSKGKFMFKKMKMALLISCLSASSYAYVIDANLTVQNKTKVPLMLTMDQPNGQDPVVRMIPAQQTSIIPMSNGDHSGLLYQTATAPFKIVSANGEKVDGENKIYAQGRVAFYVGGSLWNKYSFLNAVSAADGLTVDPVYSCANGGYGTTFENTIVIDGTPGAELQAMNFPQAVSCQGLKSSELTHENEYYTPTCYHGGKTLFWRYFDGTVCDHHNHDCQWVFGYTNGDESYGVEHTEEPTALKAALDRRVGNSYCSTWK